MLFLLIAGYLIAEKVNKFPSIFAYLGVTFVICFIAGLAGNQLAADSFRDPIINSALFLSFFMLTDPPTSPAKEKEQIVFSVIAAVISTLIYLIFSGLSYLFIGILIANLWKAYGMKSSGKNK